LSMRFFIYEQVFLLHSFSRAKWTLTPLYLCRSSRFDLNWSMPRKEGELAGTSSFNSAYMAQPQQHHLP
jgi:hypothetical protein